MNDSLQVAPGRPLEAALLASVSRERMRADLAALAEHGIRLGGCESEREAAAWVSDRLLAAGVDCELLEFDAFVSHAAQPEAFGPAAVEVLDTGERIPAKVYAFTGPSGAARVEGDVIPLGIGAPEDYRRLGTDVRGRIVLAELSFALPHSEPARLAQENGAAGLIVTNWSDRDGPRTHTSTAKWTWGNPTPEDLADLCEIPVVAVSRPDGMRLRERALAGGWTVAIEAEASRRWARAVQPVASIRGQSERFVLFHCHLDTFGAGVTDNATGIAGLLEVARVLGHHRDDLGLSVRLAWWACHEMPYDGSTWYLDSHWDELRELCVATFNADSWALAGSHDRPVALAFAELGELVDDAVRDGFGCPPEPRDFDFKEAEQSFWSPGISSAFVFSATPDFPDGPITGPWFHTEFDTLEHVDEDALEQLVRTYVLLGHRIGATRPSPLRVGALAERFGELVGEVSSGAPDELELGQLMIAADRLTRAAAALEDTSPSERVEAAIMRATRVLNPVLYTIAGPYGQDPVAASHVRPRLPGLRAALAGLAEAAGSDYLRPAWLTKAVRERNRVADAIQEATTILETAREPLT